ncbi:MULTISPECIES: oxidative stress defense protein [Vibrio]|jgi:uncharacterized protein YggE|uniref:Oxidative stress defense protein n=1 Tax=Vibrio diazotrophicus TaxID=685 RepID=A0A329EBX0_VIBDI|nr:oxidative stress defense protein [Vibrio diazotrophicus]MCZ4370922.1 oxidative stress defense protein [Vibrio diazotrophicus]PNH78153.1 oxidative stress defense protein [Vibrio diazotrophicus]PNH92916.1 oxidative stress defense protein [Vibrio diazotrophicus]PNI00033.1 oxidative stress defense protein [Vibrio diazotrophicus]RAS64419.1 hypothetical protein DET48_10952 [Vibrio diazotrophicus]
MKALSVIVLAVLSMFSMAAQAQEFDFPHVATSGYGEVIATPDMAEFSVKVVEITMNAEQAKESVDNIVTSFIKRLTQAGVKESQITSSNLYLTPQYHYPKTGKPELVGYRAIRNVSVEVDDLSKLNEYLDIALEEKINQVDDIQLKVRDEDKYQQQARMAAIKDAQQKAQSLAEGFGRKLDGVWRIDYNAPMRKAVLTRAATFSEESAVSNSYQDSTLIIRDNVNVIYKLD